MREGAAHAARALSGASRVMITTGFCVGPGLPETDGPPGAASLGRALRRLGKRVSFVTDAAATPPLQAALHALGEPTDVLVFPAGGVADHLRDGINGVSYPPNDADALAAAMIGAVEDPLRVLELRHGARHTAEALDWDEELDRLDGHLRGLIARGTGAHESAGGSPSGNQQLIVVP